MIDDFAPERRRIIGWYANQGWRTYATTCPSCSRPMVVCNADVRGCGSGVAGGIPSGSDPTQLVPNAPRVSLPNTPEQEPAQSEETQAVETEPPPSGWRDRPALL
jgi:hypothetical protein